MIKQFNFYDVYGYLIPGMLLTGILWMPMGIMTHSIPEQDLSKALFLGVLAYVAGHLLNTVSTTLVPSTVKDNRARERVVSDLLLDKSDGSWGDAVKLRLQEQVQQIFGISLCVDQNGQGRDEISKVRNAAFFQARSYLVSKKAAAYAEQFQGMYSMMRGLGCALCVGAAYFLGWYASSFTDHACLHSMFTVLTVLGVGGTVAFALQKKLSAVQRLVAILFWMMIWLSLGFALGTASTGHFGHTLYPNAQRLLLVAIVIMLIAAIKCFSAYRAFARSYAETVWRDFSASVSYGGVDKPGQANTPDEE